MPPGSATPSRRAATLTPSPKVSSASNDDVADIDSDPVLELRHNRASGLLRHAQLYSNRAGHGVDRARELDQHSVTGCSNEAASMCGDLRIDEFSPYEFEGG
jgi:hypothetical protein